MTNQDYYRRLFGKEGKRGPLPVFKPADFAPRMTVLGPKPPGSNAPFGKTLSKVMLAGIEGVGKRTLIHSLGFEGAAKSTYSSCGFYISQFTGWPVEGGKITIQMWTVSLEETCASYHNGAHAGMLMFDVGDRKSFDALLAYPLPNPGMKSVVVGNKCDRPRQVDGAEAVAYAESIDAVGYVEVSAMTLQNAKPLMDVVALLSVYDHRSDDRGVFRYDFSDTFDHMGPSCYLNPKFDWRQSP